MDQPDPWQVVPRRVFTPYDCLLISVAFVVLYRIGLLWVTSVVQCTFYSDFILLAGDTATHDLLNLEQVTLTLHFCDLLTLH